MAYIQPKKTSIYVDTVTKKEGVARATGKPYSFYEVMTVDGVKYAANDPKWETMVGGPHEIEFTERQNGKYTNRSIVEPAAQRAYVPPARKEVVKADDFQIRTREHLNIIEQKLDNLIGLMTEPDEPQKF